MMGTEMGRQITSIEPEFSLTAATADDMFALGMKYCIGHDVSQNLVAAHKWFNLAALKGSESEIGRASCRERVYSSV